MFQEITSEHWTDQNGNPAGGVTFGTGFCISWQNGPLGSLQDPARKKPNGAFVEGIIQAAMDRLNFYQQGSEGKFACIENALAIEHLQIVLCELQARTDRRVKAGTEGTHEGV